MFIIFWNFLIVKQIFLSPQVKQSVIISNKLVYTSLLSGCRTERVADLSILANNSWKMEIELFSQYAISHVN